MEERMLSDEILLALIKKAGGDVAKVEAEVAAIKDGTAIDSFSDVEIALALKQNITDDNLQTTSKEIVGALNEINGKLNSLGLSVVNGKVCQTYLA